MKTVIIHGQNHKGSTYHIARMLADKVGGEVTEFFLPRDFSDFCVGCAQCFEKAEEKCPHYEAQQKILHVMDEADLIILASPVYVYHVSAPMKNFLDHQGHRWMVHRPKPEMFRKQAVCVSTAAGAGMKSTNKDMADSLFFWGVAKTYKMGYAVRAIDWKHVPEKTKQAIEKETTKAANQIRKKNGKVTPGLKTKAFFYAMRFVQKKIGWNKADADYWNECGWTGKKRPWKS